MQGAGATRGCHRVLYAEVFSEVAFKTFDEIITMLAPPIAHGIQRVFNLAIADAWFRIVDFFHRIRISGTAITKRPPHSLMYPCCRITSSAIFQGRMSINSGLRSRSTDGGRIGMWLPGRNLPCFDGAVSHTNGRRSDLTPP